MTPPRRFIRRLTVYLGTLEDDHDNARGLVEDLLLDMARGEATAKGIAERLAFIGNDVEFAQRDLKRVQRVLYLMKRQYEARPVPPSARPGPRLTREEWQWLASLFRRAFEPDQEAEAGKEDT